MLDSFYIPLYGPSDKELIEIIQDEGSFEINNTQVHELTSGIDKSLRTPKVRALAARAAFEPTIVQHFGRSEGVMDEFVRTTEHQLTLTSPDSLLLLCVSLTKRG
jgi:jasmonate O-methyltransferase